MGDIVAQEIRTGKQVVFIYLTAGDDGRDSLYWATRELGALESTRIAVGSAATDSAADQCSAAKALEHVIRRCTIASRNPTFFGCRMDAGTGRASLATPTKAYGSYAESAQHPCQPWTEALSMTAGQT
jgi:hypothetical protein